MPVVSNVVMALIVAQCVFFNPLAEKRSLLRERKAVLFMVLFFMMQILSAALSANHQRAATLLVRRTPLLIFPLCIGLLCIRPFLKNRILVAFCWITTLITVVCLIHAFWRYYHTGDAQWLYDDSLTAFLGWQSSFMAMVVNLALFYWIFLQRAALGGKSWYYAPIGLLLAFQYLLASRICLILLGLAILIFLCWTATTTRRYWPAILQAAALAVLTCVFWLAFPKTANRFQELKYTGYQYSSHAAESHYNMPVTPDQWNGANIRLAVWKCGLAVAERHWLMGVPLGDKEQNLMTEYQNRHFDFAYRTKRDTHNTWLDVLINTGIVGLAVFALAWTVLPILACMQVNDGLGAFVVLAFAGVMVTETWIDRSLGCNLVGLFLSLTVAFHPSLSCRYKRTASDVSPK